MQLYSIIVGFRAWFSEPTPEDKLAYTHPAPFMVRDIEKLVSLFTKRGMVVLDPFVGSGTTLVAANKLGRHAIGIHHHHNIMNFMKPKPRTKEISERIPKERF